MIGRLHPMESRSGPAGSTSFREVICLTGLLEAQSPEGGWGFRPASRGAVEPTCWSLLALTELKDSSEWRPPVQRARDWLLSAQLPDGSWPAHPGQSKGCWVTALACLALHQHGEAPAAVARGMDWLAQAWSAEGSFWRRLLGRLLARPAVVRQNPSLRGWSWTPGTSSWVEPTACTLIVLRKIVCEPLPERLAKRQRLAEAMLYDRMCPQGGWNSGNPFVYGVAGEPLMGPTVWALLALQAHRARPEIQKSLDWLAASYDRTPGPSSLALAHICLETYGRPTRPLAPLLQRLYETNQFLNNVPALAFAAMALDGVPRWCRWGREGSGSR